MADCDIYIIYCNPERYTFMKTQMEALNIQSCTFVQASTPESSREWLGTNPSVNDKLKCCFKSHIDVMKMWLESSSRSDYLLILEDDVCLLKDDFVTKLRNIISIYSKTSDIDYVSIGYLPNTINKGLIHTHLQKYTNNEENMYWGVHKLDFTVWGSQAQLFTRSTIRKIVDLLYVNNADEIYTKISEYVKTNTVYQNKVIHPMIDVLLPLLFSQAIVCPPLAIENEMASTIHHDNSRRLTIWRMADKENMLKLGDYYSYE